MQSRQNDTQHKNLSNDSTSEPDLLRDKKAQKKKVTFENNDSKANDDIAINNAKNLKKKRKKTKTIIETINDLFEKHELNDEDYHFINYRFNAQLKLFQIDFPFIAPYTCVAKAALYLKKAIEMAHSQIADERYYNNMTSLDAAREVAALTYALAVIRPLLINPYDNCKINAVIEAAEFIQQKFENNMQLQSIADALRNVTNTWRKLRLQKDLGRQSDNKHYQQLINDAFHAKQSDNPDDPDFDQDITRVEIFYQEEGKESVHIDSKEKLYSTLDIDDINLIKTAYGQDVWACIYHILSNSHILTSLGINPVKADDHTQITITKKNGELKFAVCLSCIKIGDPESSLSLVYDKAITLTGSINRDDKAFIFENIYIPLLPEKPTFTDVLIDSIFSAKIISHEAIYHDLCRCHSVSAEDLDIIKRDCEKRLKELNSTIIQAGTVHPNLIAHGREIVEDISLEMKTLIDPKTLKMELTDEQRRQKAKKLVVLSNVLKATDELVQDPYGSQHIENALDAADLLHRTSRGRQCRRMVKAMTGLIGAAMIISGALLCVSPLLPLGAALIGVGTLMVAGATTTALVDQPVVKKAEGTFWFGLFEGNSKATIKKRTYQVVKTIETSLPIFHDANKNACPVEQKNKVLNKVNRTIEPVKVLGSDNEKEKGKEKEVSNRRTQSSQI